MSETKKSFQWADDANANVREPIEDLKKKGWNTLDIPTASNFNWLFNDIQKDLEAHSGKLEELDRLRNTLSSLNRDVNSLQAVMSYLLPTVVEIIMAVNAKTVTSLNPQYPFSHKDKTRPTPIPISDFGLNAEDNRND